MGRAIDRVDHGCPVAAGVVLIAGCVVTEVRFSFVSYCNEWSKGSAVWSIEL
jgi:hypothetical protein